MVDEFPRAKTWKIAMTSSHSHCWPPVSNHQTSSNNSRNSLTCSPRAPVFATRTKKCTFSACERQPGVRCWICLLLPPDSLLLVSCQSRSRKFSPRGTTISRSDILSNFSGNDRIFHLYYRFLFSVRRGRGIFNEMVEKTFCAIVFIGPRMFFSALCNVVMRIEDRK